MNHAITTTAKGLFSSLLNQIFANYVGYHIELVGWEDTVTRHGRPQEIINQDLAQCVLFVGMLWRRWGTPPSAGGRFTSGFEEEYTISVEEFKARGRPYVCLFFKEIGDDHLSDPGDNLKKVLDFRARIRNERSILYESFVDPAEFKRKFERCISHHLNIIREKESENFNPESQPQPLSVSDSRPQTHNDATRAVWRRASPWRGS